MISWETTQPRYRLALEWTMGADGMPVCLDDGTANDTVEATITGRLLPDELNDLTDAWEGTRLCTITSTGYLLGPEIDMSGGVEVTLLDLQIDGPSDSSCTMYDVTATIGSALPSGAFTDDLRLALDNGVPYPSSRAASVASQMDGGTYSVIATGGATTRRTKWYVSNLSTQYAGAICRDLRGLRGDQYGWDATGVSHPFGPGGGTSSFVRVVGWSVYAESNLTWGMELDIVQEAVSSVGDFMVGSDGAVVDFQTGNSALMVGV